MQFALKWDQTMLYLENFYFFWKFFNGTTVVASSTCQLFTFEDSEKIKAIKSVEIPARIVGHCISIKNEVVSEDILLLLSKKAMKVIYRSC